MQEFEFYNYFNYQSVLFQCENDGELQCKIQFQFHGSNFKVIRQSSDRHQTVYIPQIYFESIKQFSHYVIHQIDIETSKFSLKVIFSEKAIKFEKILPPFFDVTKQYRKKLKSFLKFLWLSQGIRTLFVLTKNSIGLFAQ